MNPLADSGIVAMIEALTVVGNKSHVAHAVSSMDAILFIAMLLKKEPLTSFFVHHPFLIFKLDEFNQ
jgi:hypothetical protein